MKPFFTYCGGKYRATPHYPSPKYDLIIEPFAGSAGYSVRHQPSIAHLYDINPIIAELWQGLIHADKGFIEALPIEDLQSTDDLVNFPQWVRYLVGFWFNKGNSRPVRIPSPWMRGGTRPNSFWGKVIRERIASQVDLIRGWKSTQISFTEVSNQPATWFIDPPYQRMGKRCYEKYGSIDYEQLAKWCLSRKGQVIVCENEGATWLPFRALGTFKGTSGRNRTGITKEIIFTREN